MKMNFKAYIEKWIIPHRRGIMGTVIFHLVLAIFLLSMEISRIQVHTEMEIVMDTPTPEERQKKEEEQQRKEEIRQKTSQEEVERMLRSIAVNENAVQPEKRAEASVQQYVDEILKELEEEGNSGRYKAQRDKNYQKDSLQNDRDKREQELDSLKSTFYAGESSVSYNLKDRYARFLPIPVFKCEYGGKVVVEILVNPKGVVQKAKILEDQSQSDDCLWRVAADAAKRSRFNEKPDAPALQKGTITYDGLDIGRIKKADLRRSLGVVLQDVNLFTGTVMENIRYGKLDATDEECIAAAKLANADGFIRMLPNGYDTVLSGDGSGLSQGQRQLISIARAAVADPPVMILDEATSSIDTRTEAIVQRGMDALMKGRTVFVIAHRLSTVQNSDVIMVLEQGHIIERGSHDKLIEEKGKYYQLYTGAFELE